MKTRLLTTALTLLCALLITSCSNDEILSNNENPTNLSVSKDPNIELKREFGKALAKVLSENQFTRELVKKEALKQINHDYDVLYLLVKDQKLTDGTTLESSLLKHLTNEQLASIEEKIPNLTIFVPELPENSFSAELWNIETDIPEVAIKEEKNPDVAIYNSSGEEYILEAEFVPGFPVVVVKENERIVMSNNNNENALRSTTNSPTKLKFIDNCFINKDLPELRTYQQDYQNLVNSFQQKNQKTLQAYNIYKGTDGWQRDYIYYDLTPTNTKGKFKNTFKEHIVAFELLGDPKGALNKISDSKEDPKIYLNKGYIIDKRKGIENSGWTDGEFEFKVKAYIGTKNAFGNELITYFRAAPRDLFNLTWERFAGGRNSHTRYTGNHTLKIYPNVNLPLFEWNLENYSDAIKIAIEEVDSKKIYESTTTTSTEFATNFNYDYNFGEKVKVGLKFGISQKENRTTAFKVTSTDENDELGEVIINFGDNVVSSDRIIEAVDRNYLFYPLLDLNKKYSTGWYRIYIAPLEVN